MRFKTSCGWADSLSAVLPAASCGVFNKLLSPLKINKIKHPVDDLIQSQIFLYIGINYFHNCEITSSSRIFSEKMQFGFCGL